MRWDSSASAYPNTIGMRTATFPARCCSQRRSVGAPVSSEVRTGIVIAPLYVPLRLAEEVAVADLGLGGRLELGLGVLSADYAAFGVDYARRGKILDELIPFLRTAWSGAPFEHRGALVQVRPLPVQSPMPI